MNRSVLFISLLVFLTLGYACNPTKKQTTKTTTSKLDYARFLKIIKHEKYTEVQIINPDNGKIDLKMALGRNVHQMQLAADLVPIQTPIKSIITLNGTDIGMLAKLKNISVIRGVSSAAYVYNPELKKGLSKGKVVEIGDFNQMNPEKVFEVASVITYSGFGKAPANEDKLRQLGVVCIPMYDWREIHPLGKAEWIKLLACLSEREDVAQNYLDKVNKNYFELLKSTKKFKQKEMVLSGSLIGDTWFMPAAQSFNARMFEQAGCNYVGKSKNGTGSASFTFEEVYRQFKDAEIWINPMFSCKSELLSTNPKYSYFSALQKQDVYCYSHNMNYFWEYSAIEPDKVLSDLIQIFHASELDKAGITKKKLYFYRKIRE